MNKDIVFYFTKKTDNIDLLIDELKVKYPHASFKNITSSSIEELIKFKSSTSLTDWSWIINIETIGWETIIDYNLEDWDNRYVHEFTNKSASVYLVPKGSIVNDEIEFKVIYKDFIKDSSYNVFFLSYDENNFNKNLRQIKEKRSDVKIVHGVKGIFNAHLAAAKQSTTDFFWVVDADATIIDAFDFNYKVPEWDFDVVHIWKSINPINFLEYGYGGVKLIPKHLLLNADIETAVDVTTSIGAKIKIMDEISNINNFATSPLIAWRSAFRECVKLSSGVIARQHQEETNFRLDTWCNKGGDRPLGEYVKGGASAGRWFGETYKGNKEMLARINDYDWLALEFESHIKMFPPETFKD